MGGSLFSSCSLENFFFIIMKKIPGYSTKYFILNFKIFQTKTKKFNYFFLLFASFIHFLIDFLNFVHFFRITFEIFALQIFCKIISSTYFFHLNLCICLYVCVRVCMCNFYLISRLFEQFFHFTNTRDAFNRKTEFNQDLSARPMSPAVQRDTQTDGRTAASPKKHTHTHNKPSSIRILSF